MIVDPADRLEQLEILYYGLVENFNFWCQRKTTSMDAYRQAKTEKEKCWKEIVKLRKKLLWPGKRK